MRSYYFYLARCADHPNRWNAPITLHGRSRCHFVDLAALYHTGSLDKKWFKLFGLPRQFGSRADSDLSENRQE